MADITTPVQFPKQPTPTATRLSQPEMPKTPPKEVMDMTFDDVPDMDRGEIKPSIIESKTGKEVPPVVLPPLEEVEKAEKPKEEKPLEKPIETPKKDDIISILKPPATAKKEEGKEKSKTDVKPISPKDIKPGARDYAGFASEEVTALKGMSNEGYAFATKVLKEKKELESLKGASYLQSPDAFQLDPQYRSIKQDAFFASKEARYWGEQLALVKSGKPCKDITGYDDKGNFIFGAEVQPTDAVEEQLRARMNSAQQSVGQLQQKAQQFGQSYQQRIQQDHAQVENERKSRFAWRQDPSLLEHSIVIDGMGEVSLNKIHSDFVNLFPPYQRNHPGVQVAGDLMIAMQIQAAQLRQATQGQQIAEEKKEELQRAEPGSIVKPVKEQSVHGIETFDDVGMPKA